MPQALRERVLDYLRGHSVMTLATQGEDGPWAAAVFYASGDDFTLYFLSAPGSLHATQLARSPRVAATIQEDQSDWARIKGVQLAGLAGEITGEEARHAQRLYGAKYPFIGGATRVPQAIAAALARIRWYRVVPDSLYFVDNSVAFGHRDRIL